MRAKIFIISLNLYFFNASGHKGPFVHHHSFEVHVDLIINQIFAKITKKLGFVDTETTVSSFMIAGIIKVDGSWSVNGTAIWRRRKRNSRKASLVLLKVNISEGVKSYRVVFIVRYRQGTKVRMLPTKKMKIIMPSTRKKSFPSPVTYVVKNSKTR